MGEITSKHKALAHLEMAKEMKSYPSATPEAITGVGYAILYLAEVLSANKDGRPTVDELWSMFTRSGNLPRQSETTPPP
jgi:hypothetical protein